MKKIGLLPRIILGLILGLLIGAFAPEGVVRFFVTISTLFSAVLKFVIPLMIISFIAYGISSLSTGATKLIGLTVAISYISTLLAGSIAFLVASNLFPKFLTASVLSSFDAEAGMVSPFFTIPLLPMFDVTGSVIFAFIVGMGITMLKNNGKGKELSAIVEDAQTIINTVLGKILVPILPLYILGVFANLTFSGSIMPILEVFGKVFLVVIILHILYITFMFVVAGSFNKKNVFTLLKNQLPAYFTAIGTQSSAVTIPVNLISAEKNGVTEQIRNFVIPLCATIHLAGSMITITCCSTAVILMMGAHPTYTSIFPFICMLGVAMVAAPGAPGGAIMAALPFLFMVGITGDSLQGLMIALYITQDSFGTAANVSGDNAIALFVDWYYKTKIQKA